MASVRNDKEDETELYMRLVLEHEGFQVTRIPSSSKKTADYRVSDDRHSYVIEVKRKEDDPECLARFQKEFLEKGEASRSESGGHTNVMAGIIRDAAKQLESTPTEPGEFKLIWFAAWGERPELQMDQFRSTLYGEVTILIATPHEGIRQIPCFYYTFNEFYKLPHIDGAIAFSEARGGLYLNSFCPKADALKQTKLFRMFEKAGAVCDPSALEASGNALIFDKDTDRRNKAAVYEILRQKYRFGPLEMLPLESKVEIYRFGLKEIPIAMGKIEPCSPHPPDHGRSVSSGDVL